MGEEKLFLIRWQNEEARGSIDVINGAWLAAEVEERGLTHLTYEAGSSCLATFDLVPREGVVLFCYGGENRAANEALDVFIGNMRIIPAEFESATAIAWQQYDGAEFEMLPVKVEAVGGPEGSLSVRTSKARERDRQLAALKRALAKANGEMRCEACDFEGRAEYGDASERCFEVHHKKPLGEGERVTVMSDLALICANCHAAIHGMQDVCFKDFAGRFKGQL